MGWSGLANNQGVSFTDAQGSGLTQKSTLPTSNQLMTRSDVINYLAVDGTNTGLQSRVLNQCVWKSDLSLASSACGSTGSTFNYSLSGTTFVYYGSKYFSISAIGNVTPTLVMTNFTGVAVTVMVTIYETDSAGGSAVYRGEYSHVFTGNGSASGYDFGIKSFSSLVRCDISIAANSSGNSSGTVEIDLACPTTMSCGTSYGTVASYCADEIGHWVDVGTTNGTVTVTYTLSSPGTGATLAIYVDYNGSTIYTNPSASFGTNLTFTFTYTYASSNSKVYVRFATSSWC